jgi:hypothetical protein
MRFLAQMLLSVLLRLGAAGAIASERLSVGCSWIKGADRQVGR